MYLKNSVIHHDLYDIGVPLDCCRRGEKASGRGIMVSDAGGAEGIGSYAYLSLSRSNYVLIAPYTFPLSGDDIYLNNGGRGVGLSAYGRGNMVYETVLGRRWRAGERAHFEPHPAGPRGL